MSTTIRDLQDDDMDTVLAINNAAVPNVNHLERDDLDRLRQMSAYCRVALNEDRVAGFLIALREDCDYHSENFRWFRSEYDHFVYIDRVVVAERYRGLGIGRVFYADVQSYAEQRVPWLTCEVNLEPRNDVSLLFHGTNGFSEVGQQSTEGGGKRVSLLAKPLPAYAFVQEHYGATG